MEKIQITIPEGFEIDMEKSNLANGEICFKEVETPIKVLEYCDIAKELFDGKRLYFVNSAGEIGQCAGAPASCTDPTNSTTKRQIESLLALNKLCNVAKYLNEGWVPNWGNVTENKFRIKIEDFSNAPIFAIDSNQSNCEGQVYFKTRELALKSIEIIGNAGIVAALMLNH